MIYSSKTVSRIGVLLIIAMVLTCFVLPEGDSFAAKKKKKVKKITFTNAKYNRKVMKKGKKFKLKVAVTPKKASKKMKYKSSNPRIVKVSKKGVVKAIRKGTAYITVTAKDKSKKKKKLKVTVGKPITKVKVTGENRVFHGNSTKLTATVTPKNATYRKIKWESSNPKVAKVDSKGKVTYKKNGTATITAHAQDGSGKKGKFKITMDSVKKNESIFVAHRGYSSKAPENSLTSFNLALQKSFGGVECDIWEVEKKENSEPDPETSEGTLGDDETSESAIETDFVVFHDTSIDRMTAGTGNTKDLKFEDLLSMTLTAGSEVKTYNSEKIPSLEQYLDLMKKYPNILPILEVKSYSDTQSRNLITTDGAIKVVNMLEERGLQDKAVIISFGRKALERFQSVDPGLKMQLLTNNTGSELTSDINWAKANDISGVSVQYKLLNSSIVNLIHSMKMEVATYTLSSQLQAYNYARVMGVDYITSNYKLWR